jgi:hypothetical protein
MLRSRKSDASSISIVTSSDRHELENQEDRCPVCLDYGDSVVIRDCGHSLCADCTTELISLHPFAVIRCPICRSPMCGLCPNVPSSGLNK